MCVCVCVCLCMMCSILSVVFRTSRIKKSKLPKINIYWIGPRGFSTEANGEGKKLFLSHTEFWRPTSIGRRGATDLFWGVITILYLSHHILTNQVHHIFHVCMNDYEEPGGVVTKHLHEVAARLLLSYCSCLHHRPRLLFVPHNNITHDNHNN